VPGERATKQQIRAAVVPESDAESAQESHRAARRSRPGHAAQTRLRTMRFASYSSWSARDSTSSTRSKGRVQVTPQAMLITIEGHALHMRASFGASKKRVKALYTRKRL